MSYFNAYMEELLDGFVKSKYDINRKYYVYKVNSKEEFQDATKNGGERRGIVTDNGIYLFSVSNSDVVHWDLFRFLKSKGLVDGKGPEIRNIEYDHDFDKYITVMFYDGQAWMGESYSFELFKRITQKGTDEYEQWKHWETVLKKIGVQLMDDML